MKINSLIQKINVNQNNLNHTLNLNDMPDFVHPENDQKVSELFTYLNETMNWPFFTLQEIYEKNKNNNLTALDYQNWIFELENNNKIKKDNIIQNINNYSMLISTVIEYMKFLSYYFFKCGEKIRCFIFLEYILKKLEPINEIINTDDFCRLYKLYFTLCRDAEDIFDYLFNKKILFKNELFYYEKGCYFERVHKYKEANETYIKGFMYSKYDKILLNNYESFENRMFSRIARDLEGLDDAWSSIDAYIKKRLGQIKSTQNANDNLNNTVEANILKEINCNFSISTGKLVLYDNYETSRGIEITDYEGERKFIPSPPKILKVKNVTNIYELLKLYLSLLYADWKKEYDNFDAEINENKKLLPFSWINQEQRPTKRNIQNKIEENEILNKIQQDYINAGNHCELKEISNNIKSNYESNANDEENNNNEENAHEISNMIENIGLNENENEPEENINNSLLNNSIVIMDQLINNSSHNVNIKTEVKDELEENKRLFENLEKQLEKMDNNKNNNNNQNINNKQVYRNNQNKQIEKNNKNKQADKNNKNKDKKKKVKFSPIGKLKITNQLIEINIENSKDQQIDIIKSQVSNKKNQNNIKNQNKKEINKTYTFNFDSMRRRLKYFHDKFINERKKNIQKFEDLKNGNNWYHLKLLNKIISDIQLNAKQSNSNNINTNLISELNLNSSNNKIKNSEKDLIANVNLQQQKGPTPALKEIFKRFGMKTYYFDKTNPYLAGSNEDIPAKDYEEFYQELKQYYPNSQLLQKYVQNYINTKNEDDIENNNKQISKNEKIEELNFDEDGDLIVDSGDENEENSKLDIKASKTSKASSRSKNFKPLNKESSLLTIEENTSKKDIIKEENHSYKNNNEKDESRVDVEKNYEIDSINEQKKNNLIENKNYRKEDGKINKIQKQKNERNLIQSFNVFSNMINCKNIINTEDNNKENKKSKKIGQNTKKTRKLSKEKIESSLQSNNSLSSSRSIVNNNENFGKGGNNKIIEKKGFNEIEEKKSDKKKTLDTDNGIGDYNQLHELDNFDDLFK